MNRQRGYTEFTDHGQVSGLLDELRIMFEEADENNDKVLDFGEFTTLMSRFLPHASDDEFKQIFDTLDTDSSGEIKYMELLETGFFTDFLEQSSALMQNQQHNQMMLRQTSEAVDFTDGNVEILQEQLRRQDEKIRKLKEYMIEEGEPAKRHAEELTVQLDMARDNMKTQALQIQELEDEVSALRQEKGSLEENLEAIKQLESEHVEELNHITRNSLAENESEIRELKEQLMAEKDRSSSLLTKISDLIRTNASCQTQMSSLQNENGRIRRETERLQFQQTRVSDRLAEMTAKYEAECESKQEWMQAAIDLENEIENQQQEESMAVSEKPALNSFHNSSHQRNATMRIGTNLDLFRADLMRQDSAISISGNDTLAEEMEVEPPPPLMDIPNRQRAQTNWGRLQSTLRVASAVKGFKPGNRPRKVSAGFTPSPPPIDTAKLAENIVEDLFPKLSSAIENVSENVATTVSTAVTNAVGNEFATLRHESEEAESDEKEKKRNQNGSISFDNYGGPFQTRTPAPSFAELISPRSKKRSSVLEADIREEELDFVDHDDDDDKDEDHHSPSHKKAQRSIMEMGQDIRAVRAWIEGSGLGKETARDQVMDQILKQVTCIREDVRTLHEAKENSDDSGDFSDVTVGKPSHMGEGLTDEFRENLIHESEDMMRRVIRDLRKEPRVNRDDWFWL